MTLKRFCYKKSLSAKILSGVDLKKVYNFKNPKLPPLLISPLPMPPES